MGSHENRGSGWARVYGGIWYLHVWVNMFWLVCVCHGNLEVAVPIGTTGPPVPAPAPPVVSVPAVPPAAAPVPAATAAPVPAPAPGSDGDPEIIWHPGSKVEIEGFVLSQKSSLQDWDF